MFQHSLIFSSVVEKGLVVAALEMFDETDVQTVVPGWVDIQDFHGKVRDRAVQQRRAGSVYEANVRIFRCPSGKVITQRLLIFREHTDTVSSGGREDLVHVRAIVQ